MKAIIIALLVSVTGVASADQRNEPSARHLLDQARAEVATTRQQWDLAVAGGHPVAAGVWAVRHFQALQTRKAATLRVEMVAAAARPAHTR